jgi:hypothetical protein
VVEIEASSFFTLQAKGIKNRENKRPARKKMIFMAHIFLKGKSACGISVLSQTYMKNPFLQKRKDASGAVRGFGTQPVMMVQF